jgi:hypothetical protein
MTEKQENISLTAILPKLPAEAQSWIRGLNSDWKTMLKLQIVGAESRDLP